MPISSIPDDFIQQVLDPALHLLEQPPSFRRLVALCQFLPGPASSKLGIALGIARAGLPGGFAAWLGFTMPSAIALILFALSFERLGFSTDAGWVHGLKVVAVAVVAQAVLGMGKALCSLTAFTAPGLSSLAEDTSFFPYCVLRSSRPAG